MRRATVPPLLTLLALLLLAPPAGARLQWCRSDPIVTLGGTTVQIWVAVPEQYVPLVNGPVRVVVRSPRVVDRELVLTDAGFNGYGEVVRFRQTGWKGYKGSGRFPAEVKVEVPVDARRLPGGTRVPVQVEILTPGAEPLVVEGTHHRTDAGLLLAPTP